VSFLPLADGTMPSVWIVISDEVAARHHQDVRVLVRTAFEGIDASGVEVRVERARRSGESFTGRAYDGRPARPRSDPATRYLVRLRVPGTLRNRGYPRSYRYPGRRTAPLITVRDWRERLVALAAHEACHVRQFREGRRRSELEAERWALSAVQAWATRGGRGSVAPVVAGVRARPSVQLELFAS
jgi:hypothetical protein